MIFAINKKIFFSFEKPIFLCIEKALIPNTVLYSHNTHIIPVFHDTPLETIRMLTFFLQNVVTKKLILPFWIQAFDFGRINASLLHERWVNKNFKIEELFKYHLFSNHEFNVIVYNHNQKIIMEITPCYKWDTLGLEDFSEKENIPTFEQFMQNYKPIAIHEISKETAKEWLKQAQDYLDIVEPQFKQWCKDHKDELYTLKEDA